MIFLLILCYLLPCYGRPLELSRTFVTNDNGENSTWKDMDLGQSRLKDPNYLLERFPINKLSLDSSNCRRSAKCISLTKNTCMGTKLPYAFTTLDLIPERVTQDIVEVDKIIIYIFFALVMFCSLFFP